MRNPKNDANPLVSNLSSSLQACFVESPGTQQVPQPLDHRQDLVSGTGTTFWKKLLKISATSDNAVTNGQILLNVLILALRKLEKQEDVIDEILPCLDIHLYPWNRKEA